MRRKELSNRDPKVKAQPLTYAFGQLLVKECDREGLSFRELDSKFDLPTNTVSTIVSLSTSKVGQSKVNLDQMEMLAVYFGYENLSDFLCHAEKIRESLCLQN